MDDICKLESCTGCGLCVSQCPVHCITMCKKGGMGHVYPQIDQSACIDCGLCKKICPTLHSSSKSIPITAFAAWSKDVDDYKSSTSGGVASVLSQYVIAKGGVVYGCAMLPDIVVKHIRVTEKDSIRYLKGSKYVQSSIVEIIPQLKEDIKCDKLVLFIGTPCQCAAVMSLFKEKPDNLFLVDLICHGVPSISMLQEHIYKVSQYPHYDTVLFREGKSICLIVVVNGKEVYRQSLRQPRYKDFYINAFFDGYTYRDCCYECQYACPERISDITIGDFWGLGKLISADDLLPHEEGCSVILPSTERGSELVNAIIPRLHSYERPVKEAVDGNNQLRAPFRKTARIKLFRALFPMLGVFSYRLMTMDKFVLFKTKQMIKKFI